MKDKTKKGLITLGIISGVILTLAGVVGSLGLNLIKAQEALGNYPLVIQNIAERFNIDPEEVNTVFEETREERESLRLDHLIDEGIISKEQKGLIEEKLDEFESKVDAANNEELTTDERRDTMMEIREELENWAEENDIPRQALRGPGGRGGDFRGKGAGMMGMGYHDFETE